MCCGYGVDGKATKGFDCLIIPGASRKTAKSTSSFGVKVVTNGDIKDSEFCGRQLGVHETTQANGPRATICSNNNKIKIYFQFHPWILKLNFVCISGMLAPFQLRFLSDNFEVSDGAGGLEASTNGNGFKVHYAQSQCT